MNDNANENVTNAETDDEPGYITPKPEDELFQDYLSKDHSLKGLFKTPRGWLILFGILIGIALIAVFVNTIRNSWTAEDVKNAIQITWQDTKWVDKESTPYGIKIVPAISFKVKNIGTRPLQYVSFQGVFEFADTGKPHSDGGAQLFKQPLMPGEESKEIFIKAFFGFKGSSKAAFMANKSEWKKMKVKIFARSKGSMPVQIGENYPVKQVIDGFNADQTSTQTSTQTTDPNTTPTTGDDPQATESFDKIGKVLQIVGHSSIWVDRIRSANKAIIVPTISFQVKNIGNEAMTDIYFKGEFYFVDNGEKLSDGILKEPLEKIAAGEISNDILIRSELGYEATSKAAFIKNNKTWRKVKVKLFAKQKDYEYVHLGTYSINQKIEGVKVIYNFQSP